MVDINIFQPLFFAIQSLSFFSGFPSALGGGSLFPLSCIPLQPSFWYQLTPFHSDPLLYSNWLHSILNPSPTIFLNILTHTTGQTDKVTNPNCTSQVLLMQIVLSCPATLWKERKSIALDSLHYSLFQARFASLHLLSSWVAWCNMNPPLDILFQSLPLSPPHPKSHSPRRGWITGEIVTESPACSLPLNGFMQISQIKTAELTLVLK